MPPWCVRSENSTHLRRRRLIGCRDTNRVDPLDPAAAVPTGHDEAHRCAVIRRQRRAIHPDGEKRATRPQRVEGEDPARAGGRRARRHGFVHAAHDDRPRGGRQSLPLEDVDQRDAIPLGHAHQAKVVGIGVARTFDQVRAHGAGAFEQRGDGQGLGRSKPVGANRPRRHRRLECRGRRGADEDLVARRDQAIALNRREIGELTGVETGAADEGAERRRARSIAVKGNRYRAGRRRDSHRSPARSAARRASRRGPGTPRRPTARRHGEERGGRGVDPSRPS